MTETVCRHNIYTVYDRNCDVCRHNIYTNVQRPLKHYIELEGLIILSGLP